MIQSTVATSTGGLINCALSHFKLFKLMLTSSQFEVERRKKFSLCALEAKVNFEPLKEAIKSTAHS